MSAIVVPFPARRAASNERGAHGDRSDMRTAAAQRPAPIRIDGAVTLYRLLTGLQSVGLSFRREPGTGVYIISPQHPAPTPPSLHLGSR